jgi:hypothetical protein
MSVHRAITSGETDDLQLSHPGTALPGVVSGQRRSSPSRSSHRVQKRKTLRKKQAVTLAIEPLDKNPSTQTEESSAVLRLPKPLSQEEQDWVAKYQAFLDRLLAQQYEAMQAYLPGGRLETTGKSKELFEQQLMGFRNEVWKFVASTITACRESGEKLPDPMPLDFPDATEALRQVTE